MIVVKLNSQKVILTKIFKENNELDIISKNIIYEDAKDND